jgi:argininosuccinate lyase
MDASKVGQRLAEAPKPELTQYLYGPRMLEERDTSFGYLGAVNLAHVVMLAERGILSRERAAALANAIRAIDEAGPAALELDPEREDLYYNYERAVIQRTGHDTGGRMHTGRSRNDLGATMTRMRCRDLLLRLLGDLGACRAAMIEQAEQHLDTIMPGYTHLQPAQPITYAHWLAALEEALSRDAERLLGALHRTELCPLGAAALAGTGFNIAREIPADLLGFPALVVNTLDGVASRDYLMETLAAGAILGATLSRLAQDLYVWYTHEFAMIDFPDSVAGTSSIMPQKKNPVVLEHIRGRTAHVAGAIASALAAVRNTPYSNVIDANREGFRPGWAALEELRISIVLTRVAVSAAIPRPELMLARCRANFSTVTELADALVRLWDISFRQAHEVVGAVVREAMRLGLDATAITADLVIAQAATVLASVPELSDEDVRAALDPAACVSARNHTGGPAAPAVAAALGTARARLLSHEAELAATHDRIAAARGRLNDRVRALLQEP